MLVLRQLATHVVEGAVTDMATAPNYEFQFVDVHPRFILKLAAGKLVNDYTTLDASASFTIPLPNAYSSANRLFVMLRSNKTLKVTTVSPAHATSVVMLKAGAAATQNGIYTFVDRVTSITLLNPQATVAKVEWFCFEYPDITKASGWRDGDFALGYRSTP